MSDSESTRDALVFIFQFLIIIHRTQQQRPMLIKFSTHWHKMFINFACSHFADRKICKITIYSNKTQRRKKVN